MKTRDLTGHIGTEVLGVDLRVVSDGEVDAIQRLAAERGVLIFRNQPLNIPEHIEFGRRLGQLHVHPAADGEPGYPEAMKVFTDEESETVAGETWHSDVSCDERPPALSILHMKDVPSRGGDTVWASTYRAYDTLSEPIRVLVDGLKAVHSSSRYYLRRYGKPPAGQEYPDAVHPVVATHPVTGRRALYVNSMFTLQLVGLEPAESDALLKLLFDQVAYGVDFQVRVQWEPDMVAIWDNRCTQHHATWDYHPEARRAHRVTTKGARPSLDV